MKERIDNRLHRAQQYRKNITDTRRKDDCKQFLWNNTNQYAMKFTMFCVKRDGEKSLEQKMVVHNVYTIYRQKRKIYKRNWRNICFCGKMAERIYFVHLVKHQYQKRNTKIYVKYSERLSEIFYYSKVS